MCAKHGRGKLMQALLQAALRKSCPYLIVCMHKQGQLCMPSSMVRASTKLAEVTCMLTLQRHDL